MASMSVHCHGGRASCSVHLRGIGFYHASSSLVSMIDRGTDNHKYTIPISISLSCANSVGTKRIKQKRDETVSHQNVIDKWMKNSVTEIVKNLREAPLLVYIYSDNDHSTRMKTEKAVSENWPSVKSKWGNGTTPFPEGMIFVEQLKEDKEETESDSLTGESEMSRAWGIVLQMKGQSCSPACYLLKMSEAGLGFGMCCTHFSLMKVKSFTETTADQLSKCWLFSGVS